MNKAVCALCAVLYLAVTHTNADAQNREITVLGEGAGATIEVRPTLDGPDGFDRAVLRLGVADVGEPAKVVDVDVRNATVREALKLLLTPAKLDYKVDDDVPSETRVTLSAKSVRLKTVLDLLAQAADVGWQQELTQGKTVIRFSKAAKQWTVQSMVSKTFLNDMPILGAIARDPSRDGLLWRRFAGKETRSTLTCEHCRSQITVLREAKDAKCPKCGLLYEESWKLCPRDGTKRPESGADWKFCPICGKSIARNR